MKSAIVINNEFFGHGDVELGIKLMGNFLRKVWGRDEKPAFIILYNTGVKLLADGSASLDALNGLAEAGVDLVACGTCISHFGLQGDIKAGRISDMQEIVDIMAGCDRVITI